MMEMRFEEEKSRIKSLKKVYHCWNGNDDMEQYYGRIVYNVMYNRWFFEPYENRWFFEPYEECALTINELKEIIEFMSKKESEKMKGCELTNKNKIGENKVEQTITRVYKTFPYRLYEKMSRAIKKLLSKRIGKNMKMVNTNNEEYYTFKESDFNEVLGNLENKENTK